MAELSCTCGPGESVAGTRQEIIEQRLAERLGLTVREVHVLLDLLDRTLDDVLDLPKGSRADSETERRMVAESGRPEFWIKSFLEIWEGFGDEVEREQHEMHGPWGGIFGKQS